MIVTLHLASGALAGTRVRSRGAALLLGPPLHLLGDLVPHRDIGSRGFEAASGVTALLALAAAYGPLDPVTLGAFSAAAPDLEHVVPLLRPGGRELFPSHRWKRLHRSGPLPGWAQFALAGGVIGALIACREDRYQRPWWTTWPNGRRSGRRSARRGRSAG